VDTAGYRQKVLVTTWWSIIHWISWTQVRVPTCRMWSHCGGLWSATFPPATRGRETWECTLLSTCIGACAGDETLRVSVVRHRGSVQGLGASKSLSQICSVINVHLFIFLHVCLKWEVTQLTREVPDGFVPIFGHCVPNAVAPYWQFFQLIFNAYFEHQDFHFPSKICLFFFFHDQKQSLFLSYLALHGYSAFIIVWKHA
jgi:hypothetical protein